MLKNLINFYLSFHLEFLQNLASSLRSVAKSFSLFIGYLLPHS